MGEAVLALFDEEIAKTEVEALFHYRRGGRVGNIEWSFASHKIAWLKALRRRVLQVVSGLETAP